MKILLSRNSVLNPTANRIVIIIISILFIAQAIIHMAIRPIQYDIIFFLDLVILLSGIWALVLGLFILSKNSNFVPRVEINESSVLILNRPFGKPIKIDLENISKIRFGSFEFTFYEKKGNFDTYQINTNRASESLKIKEQLRKEAVNLGITVDDEISTMIR